MILATLSWAYTIMRKLLFQVEELAILLSDYFLLQVCASLPETIRSQC